MPSPENAELLDAMADQIRAALDDALSAASFTVQVEPRLVFAPSPPTVDMYPGDLARGTEARAFGTEGEFLFTVRCRVNPNDADANQDILLGMMDDVNALSVPMALLDEPTLGGLAADVDVRDVTGFNLYPFGADSLVGFQFTAVVIRADS